MVKADNDFYDYGTELILGSILPLVMFKSFWKLSQVKDIVAHIQIINPLWRPLTLSTNSESASSGVFNSPLQLQLDFFCIVLFSGDCKVFGYVINAVRKCVDGNLDLAWKISRVCIELRWSWHLVKKGWISTRQCKLSASVIVIVKLHLGNNMG